MTDSLLTSPLLIVTLALGFALWLFVMISTRRQPRGDTAARHMASQRQLRALSPKQAGKTAQRLGAPSPGLRIGRAVRGGRELVQSWDRPGSVDIAGPGAGKTTARCVPAILDAPGAVLATSNKRDLVDVTRGPRSTVGPVHVFDPQGVAGEPAAFWWNPLRAITDEIKAGELADVFAAAVTGREARTDSFFDGKGRKLVAAFLLAAASAGRTIDQCHVWVTDLLAAEEAVAILKTHGHERLAASLLAELHAPEKQRGGVLGSAERLLGFLTHREALVWITPGAGRPEFQPAAFVNGRGTLYSLSREGAGSAAALVAALTGAVTAAAERLAIRSPGGRLAVPLVCVLDEAANVVRLPTLPDLYSHYGSRGIALLTFLQSWSQGVEVWGEPGMRKLWSAATVKVYGGGCAERDFLSDLSQLVGQFDRPVTSTAHGRNGRSTTRGTARDWILPVDQLASLPPGRAVVFAAGTPAVLAQLVPWMSGPRAKEIRAHLAPVAA